MPLPSIPDIHSPRYEARGECRRCGACCKVEDDGKPCKHLSFEDGRAVCSIYDSRFDRCRNFPSAPPVMIDTCGYRFYDTWEDRELGPKEI